MLPAIKGGKRFLACPLCVKERGLIPVSTHPVPVVTAKVSYVTVRKQVKRVTPPLEGHHLIEDFGAVVRQARERLGLTQAELAKQISEKLSVIKKIEAGRLKPDELLARKLERALKVKLIEEGEEA